MGWPGRGPPATLRPLTMYDAVPTDPAHPPSPHNAAHPRGAGAVCGRSARPAPAVPTTKSALPPNTRRVGAQSVGGTPSQPAIPRPSGPEPFPRPSRRCRPRPGGSGRSPWAVRPPSPPSPGRPARSRSLAQPTQGLGE
jgi:hypothetical protein